MWRLPLVESIYTSGSLEIVRDSARESTMVHPDVLAEEADDPFNIRTPNWAIIQILDTATPVLSHSVPKQMGKPTDKNGLLWRISTCQSNGPKTDHKIKIRAFNIQFTSISEHTFLILACEQDYCKISFTSNAEDIDWPVKLLKLGPLREILRGNILASKLGSGPKSEAAVVRAERGVGSRQILCEEAYTQNMKGGKALYLRSTGKGLYVSEYQKEREEALCRIKDIHKTQKRI
ncbi:hypothetical protein CPC08DRAFT_751610 [Agrocybe pediades]|nr:hypothetical protein CPC08DRAFT_751610 [Agrocybe pediades]